MKRSDAITLFGMNNLRIEADIQRIEKESGVDFGHKNRGRKDIDETYYPQFPEKLRDEAAAMTTNYVIFYCLENSIRELIVNRLSDPQQFGEEWWDAAVPEGVKVNAKRNHKREIESGITPRSEEMIDYTNFGELGEIIITNWDIFGETFSDKSAIRKVMSSLNTLRAPVAHSKALAEDEVLRLHLSLRDYFRQME